ncbi:hypothetical protein [Flavobacterium sp.]|uniref:hypothetical protein n=1 Tax=Flavobacterium sp. TaxID=239 RepID=UPI00286CBAE2|nr:hypothetical protein [Flavobacterium sp.]
MKKIFLTVIFGAITFSCSSDSSSGTSLTTTPDARTMYDSSNYGIYKGVFVGSTGTVLVNINNEGGLSATLTINGSTSTYTTTETVTLDSAISGLTFTNGSSSFDFSVDSGGDNPTVSNITISGHPNATIIVLKEFSDSLVKCYVGTFSGDDSGTFNFIIEGNEIEGLGKSSGDDSSIPLSGMLSGNSIAGSFEGGTFSGSQNNNNISGTWQNSASETGNWSGSRKL